MAVRPYIKRNGERVAGSWEIDLLPFGKGGPRYRRKFVGTEAEALQREAEMLQAMRRTKRANPYLQDVYADFLDAYRLDRQESTVKSVQDAWARLKPFFGHIRLAEIIPHDVDDFKRQRLQDGVTKRTINKELSYLSSILKWAEDQGYVSNPIKPKRFPTKQTKPPTPRIPSKDKLDKMIDAIEPEYRPILLLYIDAGLRRREALDLTGEQVDLENRMMIVRGKGDKERLVPIATSRLYKAIKSVHKSGYLFVNPKTDKPYYSIFKALRRAAKKVGISERVYHHLLRHSFGTYAMVAGVDLRAIQGMMGHSTSKVTEIYTHLGADYLKSQASKLDASNGGGKERSKGRKSKRKSKRKED